MQTPLLSFPKLSQSSKKENSTQPHVKEKAKTINFHSWHDLKKKKKLTSINNTNANSTAKKTMQERERNMINIKHYNGVPKVKKKLT